MAEPADASRRHRRQRACPGPYGVGHYAARLRDYLRERSRVQLFGEVWNLRVSRAKVYFELRDADGALPCSMWRNGLRRAAPRRGRARRRRAGRRRRRAGLLRRQPHLVAGVLVRGRAGCASPARATCSPSSTGCARRSTPRACSSRRSCSRGRRCRARSASSPARAARRATTCSPACAGAAGRGALVWAFAPVQDRHAAPRITRALQDLAATGEVDVIVVARGGGSLADLFCFCDETLCRTVALLGVPVIASVGHHTDRTLIDDVAALSCSTPTHAAESAVPVHCTQARDGMPRLAHGRARAATAGRAARRAAGDRRRAAARASASTAGARCCTARRRSRGCRGRRASTSPASARGCTRACARCAPSGRRRLDGERARIARRALVLDRKAHAAALDARRATRPAGARAGARRARPRRARSSAATRSSPTARASRVTSAAAPRARPATCRCASATPRSMRRSRATMTEPEPSRSPTRPRPPAWRRSSSAWTPARPACARRSSSAARAARSSSCAPPSSRPSARASRSCASTTSSRASRRGRARLSSAVRGASPRRRRART